MLKPKFDKYPSVTSGGEAYFFVRIYNIDNLSIKETIVWDRIEKKYMAKKENMRNGEILYRSLFNNEKEALNFLK